jgi:hypothetical protein
VKKVVFYLFIILTVLCALAEVTALQLLPLAAGVLLMDLDIFGKKSMAIPLTVLSIIMILINGTMLSIIDIVIWVIACVAFLPKE